VYGGPREARLSTAAIDVLALVAYRQPATKAEVDSLRGAESGSLLAAAGTSWPGPGAAARGPSEE